MQTIIKLFFKKTVSAVQALFKRLRVYRHRAASIFQALLKRKAAGFSLIELLVVVAIIGILSAVAIPAFRKYQQTAQSGVIQASLNAIGKGVAACLTTNEEANCRSQAQINVNCGGMISCVHNSAAMQPICFDVFVGGSSVGSGNTYRGCVSVSLDTGLATTLNGYVGSAIPCTTAKPTTATCSTTTATNAMGCPTNCATNTHGTCTAAPHVYKKDGSCKAGTKTTFTATEPNLPKCTNSSGECE